MLNLIHSVFNLIPQQGVANSALRLTNVVNLQDDELMRWAKIEYPYDWEYAYECLKNNQPIQIR